MTAGSGHSRIYAGLEPATPLDELRALSAATAPQRLAGFTPKPGDVVFVPAGTVQRLGGDVVVFEVQQNSDLTFRLPDWDRVDRRRASRDLQLDEALACVDTSGARSALSYQSSSRPRRSFASACSGRASSSFGGSRAVCVVWRIGEATVLELWWPEGSAQ